MGCDIHIHLERKVKYKWVHLHELEEPLKWRSYDYFGVLAGVRNYAANPPICEPRGLPPDVSEGVQQEADNWDCDGHTHSWFLVSELLAFDWNKPVEDRRVTRQISPNYTDGGCTCEPGEGRMTTYREMFGVSRLAALQELSEANPGQKLRLVFWFDS